MFVDFFIRRSVFTSVWAIIILLVGAISIPTLPTEQYPEISPTQIIVNANYPGASAEVVENTITTILERQINGIEGVKYMSSSSSILYIVIGTMRDRLTPPPKPQYLESHHDGKLPYSNNR